MPRPYAEELTKLADTFIWAATTDLRPLQQAIRLGSISPLRAVGSGGSLTGAHALAGLHQRYAGRVATAVTPMMAMDEPLEDSVATWLLSAGGSNVDIMAAAKTIILREPRQLSVLCGRPTSPLAKLCRQHPFVDLLLYPPPTDKDGFLATNSLLGFSALLTRAYATELGSEADWRDVVGYLEPLLSDTAAAPKAWEAATVPLWTRRTTLVLHGPSTWVGAVDLESKFTEAALGHIQIADYRNFAHGRHHWLAKRSETSAVLAFITAADRSLAERTLSLIPAGVPQARLAFDGGPSATALASLLAAIRIAGWAGSTRGIDPGRPGVPAFGRMLYRLPLPRPRRRAGVPRLTPREAAAITRKAGIEPSRLATLGEFGHWHEAFTTFRDRLRSALFAGIVLDYDGTVVDTRYRFHSAEPKMADELARLVKTGVHIAVATGRGKSVRHELQRLLPPELWPLVLVGYYNGAEVAWLNDNSVPNGCQQVCTALLPLREALHRHPELSGNVKQEDRLFQITLQPTGFVSPERLWDVVHNVITLTRTDKVSVTRSGHSIDIVTSGVSKLNVIRRLRESITDASILTIGDRGRWPGNDHELLSEPFALGVDEVSVDPATCWHLGEPGQRGPTVTLDYLLALKVCHGGVRFAAGSLQ